MRSDEREKNIHRPVSHDHITGSSVQLIEVMCFFSQPLPIPQTTLDSFIQNYSLVSTLYRVGEGELQDIFKKVALFCEGNQEVNRNFMTAASLSQGLLSRIVASFDKHPADC